MATTTPSPLPDATRLALDRTRLAHDRTLMAWVRTSTSLISFGFTIYKFFEYLLESQAPRQQLIGPRGFALIMIGLGIGALILAIIEHRRDIRALSREYGQEVPYSLTTSVAGMIILLGVFFLFAVLFRE